jgi:hypothetical protein
MWKHVEEIFQSYQVQSRLLPDKKLTDQEWRQKVTNFAAEFHSNTFLSTLSLPKSTAVTFMASYAYLCAYTKQRNGKLLYEFPFDMAFAELCSIKAKGMGHYAVLRAHFADSSFQHERITNVLTNDFITRK